MIPLANPLASDRSRHQHETASRRTPIRTATISRTKTSDEMSVPGHTPRQGHGQCSAQIGSARWVGVCQLPPRACADYPVLFAPGRDRPAQPRDWSAELLRQMRHDPESGGMVLRGHPPLPARHGGPAVGGARPLPNENPATAAWRSAAAQARGFPEFSRAEGCSAWTEGSSRSLGGLDPGFA